jgi:hypothetical protein
MESLAHMGAAALLASSGLTGEMPMVRVDCGAQFCKSTPAIEGGERVLYMEASSEARDVQNEEILASALEDSKDYFLKYGRIDLDHATVWQMIRETKLDPANPYAKEIGRPLDVRVTRRPNDVARVWVKAAIFKGQKDNDFAKAANWFWNTMEVQPPVIWYPSVAGTLLPGGRTNLPDGGRRLTKLRWHSIGLSRNPVNTNVQAASAVPLDVFCKAMREGADISGALAALAGYKSAPSVADGDVALRDSGIMVPSTQGGSVAPGILTPDKADMIHRAILQAQPPYDLNKWLADLVSSGISPQEGMAYLLSVLDSGRTALE